MKNFLVSAAVVLGSIAAVLALTWGLTGNDLALYRFFAPKYEQARRETFENTKSYRDGMAKELEAMRFQYEQADPAHRTALADIIIHRAAGADQDALGGDLYAFVQQLRRERETSR